MADVACSTDVTVFTRILNTAGRANIRTAYNGLVMAAAIYVSINVMCGQAKGNGRLPEQAKQSIGFRGKMMPTMAILRHLSCVLRPCRMRRAIWRIDTPKRRRKGQISSHALSVMFCRKGQVTP